MTSFSVFFFFYLDNIVHGDLYGYGLRFSYEWANQYWNYMRLILGFLGASMLITCASIALIWLQRHTHKIGSAKFVTRILLVMGILIFVLSIFLFTRLDNIVRGDLYGYGLRFSYEWANQYWNYMRLILGFLGIAIGMNGVSFVQTFVGAPMPEKPVLPSLSPLFRINLTRLTCYLLTSIGVIALSFSINYNSSILAFIGLGLVFWGIILLYIKPENYVKGSLLDKTTLPSLTNLNQIVKELGYKGKGVYLSPKYFKGFESSKVYINTRKDMKLPPTKNIQDEKDKIFIKNPDGVLIASPGLELKRLFEKTLGTNFTSVDLQYLEQNISKLLVEDLEIAREVKMERKNDRVFVKIENSIYQAICKEAKKHSEIHGSLGCPLCSAIACALAEATGKSVVIEKEQTSDIDQTTKIEYHLLEGPREEQTQK
jgi:hypothetical protein